MDRLSSNLVEMSMCSEDQALALRDNFSIISLESKSFRGVPHDRSEESVSDSPVNQILPGQDGIPRSYRNA